MANWQKEPEVGHTVWTEARKNGIITRIDFEFSEVYVNHYDNGFETYPSEAFFGCFDERLNQWVIT